MRQTVDQLFMSTILHIANMRRMLRMFTVLFQNTRTLKFRTAFTTVLFASVNHNYDHKQRTLTHGNTQNGSKSTNHES